MVKSSIQNKKLSFAIASITFAIYLVCVFLISRWYVQGLKIEYLSNDIINKTEIIEKEENVIIEEPPSISEEPITITPVIIPVDLSQSVDNSIPVVVPVTIEPSTNNGMNVYGNVYY